jgi:hypothetical protein
MRPNLCCKYSFKRLAEIGNPDCRLGKAVFSRAERETFQSRFIQALPNLADSVYGALDPDNYFKEYAGLIAHLRDPVCGYEKGPIIARCLEESAPKTISVADVYVPYCYLYSDRLICQKGSLKGSESGGSEYKEEGNKNIVVNLDYNHFRQFLETTIF